MKQDTPLKRALRGDRSVTREDGRAFVVTRVMPVEDMVIRPRSKGGDGRTVDAYAAVFMTPTEIVDDDGQYREQNDPKAFNRSLATRKDQVFCIYNHGKTLGGTPSDIWSVPIGTPLEIRPDSRGLFTSTRYNKDPEADRILEAIKSGSLRGMSYTGVFLRSSPELQGPFDRYSPGRNGELTLVTRMEIALIEYGPTPVPAFKTAEVVGVRNQPARDTAYLVTPPQAYFTTSTSSMPPQAYFTTTSTSSTNGMVNITVTPAYTVASRDGTPIHHTDVSAQGAYVAEHHVGKMSFPTSWDGMMSMYALADRAAGADGKYHSDAGMLPHHIVDDKGLPGPAHLQGVKDALNHVDDQASGETVDAREKARAHLNAHLEDARKGHSVTDVTPGPGNATSASGSSPHIESGYGGAGSSGRDGGEGHGRAANDGMAGDAMTIHEHSAFDGDHSHGHAAHGGPDANNDGVHAHTHTHSGDSDHDHPHPSQAEVQVSSSGRDGEEGRERKAKKKEKKRAKYDPDHDGDDDSSAEGDTDHDYVKPDGSPGPKAKDGDSGSRADTGAWDGSAAMSKCANSKNPASAYASVCAGRRSGDPSKQSSWALPHHSTPGGPPNENGVRNALSRLPQTQGLTNKSAAESHLKAHLASFGGKSDKTSSSGRHPLNGNAVTGPQAQVRADPRTHSAPGSNGKVKGMEPGQMTVEERIARQSEIRNRFQELDSTYLGGELPPEARAEWRELQEELVIHERAVSDAMQRRQYLETILSSPDDGNTEGVDNGHTGFDQSAGWSGGRSYPAVTPSTGASNGARQFAQPRSAAPAFHASRDIYDITDLRTRARSMDEMTLLMRENAYRAIDIARFGYTGFKTREQCQETVTNLLDRVDDERGTLARRVLVTGSPIYDRAFGKALAAMSTNGLTQEESRALALGVDTAGGYAVPFQLDPTVIITSNGAINPLRQISRVEQITGKEWDGVTSANITVTRVAEGTEAGSADPAFVQPNVRTTRVQGFIPFNIELDVSWGALRSQMTNLLMDAKDVEEATAFTLGNGTAPQANGVVTTLGTASQVFTASSATLAIADLYSLENAMAPRFRQQSSYLASKTTYNRFRQLFQALASAAFDSWVRPSAGTPATFNGYPAYEQSAMANTITSGSRVLLQGDFSQFLIVDRIGMGIELIPHLFGATNRYPVGQRGILAIWFNNSQVLVPNAFRLLTTL